MAYHVKVIEVVGNPDDIDALIETAITGITIAASSVPSIAVAGVPPRYQVILFYRDA